MNQKNRPMIKGISVCNPVDVNEDYLLFTVDYAAAHGFNHLQVIGPIHDYKKGNIDGMTLYRKYGCFNDEKDAAYAALSRRAVNAACARAREKGLRTYMWHHELYLPDGFKEAYPEILNDYGDIEVSHPRVQDFLENKIRDFFFAYPDMDGIVLTLHETSVPLLKLKHQKLDKVARVKHVTKILYDACRALDKELIVRPFASLEEDYALMTGAYEEISPDLIIMDKWTQFDWSLTMPSNPFFRKIRHNPLLVEADIFGEFFGKGRLPLMLHRHIQDKFAYCGSFSPAGYAARIDRNGQIPFGDVNEVNLVITEAYLNGADPDAAIDRFFAEKYPRAAREVRSLMEETEEILKKTIYINGYLFSELSLFPSLNHCKNHYYFEMMRADGCIDSNEWYIPQNWQLGSLDSLLAEKQEAVEAAEALLARLPALKEKMDGPEYEKLWVKFCNLKYVTKIWRLLALVHIRYVRYFETSGPAQLQAFEDTLAELSACAEEGRAALGRRFYCLNGNHGPFDFVRSFLQEVRESFYAEKKCTEAIRSQAGVLDYIVCGGALEGHRLQKEVNFSDTQLRDGELCRIPGNGRGGSWSSINAHGWFSYQLAVKPLAENTIAVRMGSPEGRLDVEVTIGSQIYTLHEAAATPRDFLFSWTEDRGESSVRIRFDKLSGHIPCIYTIKSLQ